MYNQEQIALCPRWCSCMTAVTLYSFWGTLVGTLWLCNLFHFKSWNKEQHTVGGLQHSFPCPKTPGLTLHVLQCYLLTLSISCWLVWLQPQSAFIAPLENRQQDRGDVFTTGWIHPCSAKGHVVSSVSARMDALLLWAPTNTPSANLGTRWPCWCRLLFQGKILTVDMDICVRSRNLFMKICNLQFLCLLRKEK